MNDTRKRVVIVPCSGIGKTYGSVSREAAYDVSEDMRPESTQLVPLSLLVLGDAQARAAVADAQAITIDGCKLACATKMVKDSGGTVAKDYAVLDVYRRYKQFKPQGIAELNEGGQQLANALAQEIAQVLDGQMVHSSIFNIRKLVIARPHQHYRDGNVYPFKIIKLANESLEGFSPIDTNTDWWYFANLKPTELITLRVAAKRLVEWEA